MLAFIIALLIVVIIGSIVYGIYKLIVGIIKLCRKSSTDQSKRTYEEREKIFSRRKQSTTKNCNNEYYRRRENKNPFDEHYRNRHWYEDDEDVFSLEEEPKKMTKREEDLVENIDKEIETSIVNITRKGVNK